MRIGFDVSQTCVEKAGCGYYADSLAKALAQTFPQFDFILYHHFGRWHNESTKEGTHIDLPNVTAPLVNWDIETARSFWSSKMIDKRALENPDVVIGNNFQMPYIKDTFRVFTVHDISFWTRPEFHTDANRLDCQTGIIEALTNAHAYSFVSKYSKEKFISLFPEKFEDKKLAVTPLAPRGTPHANILKNIEQRNYWLSVGTLEPRKNIETLLDAYSLYHQQSKNPKPLILAGGTGWKSQATKLRIDKMSASMPIEHLGYVSDSELENLYANAFAFIFPSWYEGFGLPVIEAMNQGTPIITSLESSLKEIAEGYSLSFDPESASELSEKMAHLESKPSIWNKFQKLSINRAKDYSWNKTARELCKILPIS